MSDKQIQSTLIPPMVAPYQRVAVRPELKASNDDQREALHLISSGAIDRAGDVVEPGGAGLDNFIRNPVVMRNHSYLTQDIIGRATSITLDDDGIWARTQFRDTEVGREAFALSKEGLGGWSIGFRPIEHESITDDKGVFKGVRFKQWELLEYSQVPIPMNQDAVQSAIQRGLVSEENVSLFFDVTSNQIKTVEAPEKPADEAAPSGANVEPDNNNPEPNPERESAYAKVAAPTLDRIDFMFRRQEAARAAEEILRNTL